MDAQSTVVVSRKWHEPAIRAWVSQQEIGMSMWLEDYIKSLAAEIGNPALILTQAQLLKKLQLAAAAIETEMKLASRAIIK